jgi:hypothetical protein
MGVYVGAIPPAPGVVVQPVCFTAGTARLVRAALTVGTGLLGTIVGALIGTALSTPLEGGPPVSAIIGAVIGGAVGLIYITQVISAGTCPCPPGTQGFCIGVMYLRLPPAPPIFISLVPVNAPPGSCAVIPPGCP